MKKVLFALMLISTSLLADQFEDQHQQEIQAIFKKADYLFPNEYELKNYYIKVEIQQLRKFKEIKKEYGIE
jgi:hypothetical protein